MKRLTVDMSLPATVQIGATGLVGLAQEIRTVLATRKGSVPLDRDFGLTWDPVDMPMNMAMQHLIAEIGQGLEKFVPRIRVVEIEFVNNADDTDGAMDGRLVPKVMVEIREEYYGDFR